MRAGHFRFSGCTLFTSLACFQRSLETRVLGNGSGVGLEALGGVPGVLDMSRTGPRFEPAAP